MKSVHPERDQMRRKIPTEGKHSRSSRRKREKSPAGEEVAGIGRRRRIGKKGRNEAEEEAEQEEKKQRKDKIERRKKIEE